MTAFAAVLEMAATQAESQINETNREHLQHEKPSELVGNSGGLQNGSTDKNGARLESDPKVKFSGYNVGMSQYREANISQQMQHENVDELGGKDKGYLDNGNDGYGKGLPEGGPYMAYSPRSSYGGHSEHGLNSGEANAASNCNSNNLHPNNNQFGLPRHPFGAGAKNRPQGPHMNAHAGNFGPHAPPQRFMSGQSISQQMGPTPTLNQLLQSSNSAHRYQNNSYAEYGGQKPNEGPQAGPYNPGWNARPMAPYMNQQSPVAYRNQMPVSESKVC